MNLYEFNMTNSGYLSIAFVICGFFLLNTPAAVSQELHEKPTELLPADMDLISPDAIPDHLADLPVGHGAGHRIDYYIGNFHQLANAVRPVPPAKGFIDIPVWRRPGDNRPYNARVMENITTLAWFYTQEPSWNPYYGNPDLRWRLESALRFWLSIQHSDGRFSEYGYQRWNLPATAFATKFMGETLELLETGPPIDQELHENVRLANRKALMTVFTMDELHDHGRRFSNQYGNAFTGALSYLHMNPDDTELREAFEARLETSLEDFQSPAGYFYETDGPDWGYAFGTHLSNVLMAWFYAKEDDGYAGYYIREHEHFIDWLSYNAVKQPDRDLFVLNKAIESRTSLGRFQYLETPISERVPLARAFNVTVEEAENRLAGIRKEMTESWGDIPQIREGVFSSYSAYAFLHRRHHNWRPTESQREDARQKLPWLASDRFNHQRVDDRRPFEATYIRRPRYYAVFNAGDIGRDSHRFGLGLLWSPHHGVLMQSQSRSETAAWGTMSDCSEITWEGDALSVQYDLDGRPWDPQPGAGDIPEGVLTIDYPLGSPVGEFGNMGIKKISFSDISIDVDIRHSGSFTEVLPLIRQPGDELMLSNEKVVLIRNGKEIIRIVIEHPDHVDHVSESKYGQVADDLEIWPVHIHADEKLSYKIIFH
jgi:hypothetical protein